MSVVIFVLVLSAAHSIGFVPYYVDGTEPTRSRITLNNLPGFGAESAPPVEAAETVVPDNVGMEPERIRIDAIDLDLPVSNPQTRDIDALTEVLKDGPARYMDSALLGEKGNVLVFGHSSQLPVVYNQMYKAFNKIPDLKPGDTITIEGGGKAYMYSVINIEQVDANEGVIDLSREGQKLTLVTCDTLSGKSARFVLNAEFVGVYDV